MFLKSRHFDLFYEYLRKMQCFRLCLTLSFDLHQHLKNWSCFSPFLGKIFLMCNKCVILLNSMRSRLSLWRSLLYISFYFLFIRSKQQLHNSHKLSQFCHYSLRRKDQLFGFLETDWFYMKDTVMLKRRTVVMRNLVASKYSKRILYFRSYWIFFSQVYLTNAHLM